ncbi:MAG TPA: OmpH family outer membrane protein [Chthonomonadaceae bacterium]|nr:OmpH family outer membrane protein [Chthonomonadaceae bacterium]
MRIKWAAVALCGIGLCSGVAAPAQPVAGQLAAQRMNEADYNLKALAAELDGAEKHFARLQEQYKAGQVSMDELDGARERVEVLKVQYQRANRDRQFAASRAAFMKRVDLQVEHAKIGDVAKALSKAANVSIVVDRSVAADPGMAITMDVQGVPLAAVLESVAQKADLMIAPDGDGAILKRWPRMNGRAYHDPTAPWSADWGVPPTMAMQGYMSGYVGPAMGAGGPQPGGQGVNPFFGSPGAQGRNPFGGGQGPQPGANPFFGGPGLQPGQANPFQPGNPGTPGMNPGMAGMAPGMPVTMASLGDHLIAIAEPGVSNGEGGVWITAYMFEGNGFHRVGRIFHPFMGQSMGPGLRPVPGAGGPPRAGQQPGAGEGATGSNRL